MTRLAEICHPPSICWTEGDRPSCGMSSRANHVTSAAAADNSSAHARRRPRRRSRTANVTATTSTTAPISHHNQAGVEVVLLEEATTAWVCVAAGVAG